MEDIKDPIKAAHSIIYSEVRRKKLGAVNVSISGQDWLKIGLQREGRVLWLGYKGGSGYFVSWDKGESRSSYFDLNEDTVLGILNLLPGNVAREGVNQQPANKDYELFDSINEPNPDPEKIRQIIDESPSTEEGIDVLATVASIKAYRNAIDRLRALVETQAEPKPLESEYQNLLALHPWMLGSYYTEVLAKEYEIWFKAKVDLMLISALGYIDIVELKRPDTVILRRGDRTKTWSVSAHLADAQAQARKYLKFLDEHRAYIEDNLPIAKQAVSRIYRSGIIIVAGRNPENAEALEALKDINASDGRITILTYDNVLAIAEATIKIFERRLQRSSRLLG